MIRTAVGLALQEDELPVTCRIFTNLNFRGEFFQLGKLAERILRRRIDRLRSFIHRNHRHCYLLGIHGADGIVTATERKYPPRRRSVRLWELSFIWVRWLLGTS